MDVVRCGERHRRGRLADRDGDGLAVGQLHYQIGTGDLVVHGSGVGHHATFSNRRICGQGDGGGVNGVGNFSHCRRAIHVQLLEVPTVNLVDGDCERACIQVNIIARRRNGHMTFGLTRSDRNDRAVAQRYGHGCASRIAQCHGISDYATL
ncbi:hypothetical protein D3C79_522450 [compost metagenome]